MIKIDEIPRGWSNDQIEVYELYSKYLADSDNSQAIEEFEKLLTMRVFGAYNSE